MSQERSSLAALHSVPFAITQDRQSNCCLLGMSQADVGKGTLSQSGALNTKDKPGVPAVGPVWIFLCKLHSVIVYAPKHCGS